MVKITNVGNEPFMGPIGVVDSVPFGMYYDAGGLDTLPPWKCAYLPGVILCNHPGLTLQPGASTEVTIAGLRFDEEASSGPFENCAELKWSGKGDVQPSNDRGCTVVWPEKVAMPVTKLRQLTITKTADSPTCTIGGTCAFTIEVKVTVADHQGEITVSDWFSSGGKMPLVKISPPWSCGGDGSGWKCTHPAIDLAVDETVTLTLEFDLSDFKGDRLSNCAKVGTGPPTPVNRSCVEVPIEDQQPQMLIAGPDLALAKTAGTKTCAVGKICPYDLTITNAGQTPFNGTLTVADSFSPANAALVSSGPAPWKCRSAGATHTCTHPQLELKPGAAKTLKLNFRSSGRARGQLSNCAQLQWAAPVTPQNRTHAVQQELKARGYRIGAVDGKAGRQTRAAIREYERKAGLAVTGQINAALLGKLFKGRVAGDANPRNDKACVTVDLQAGASDTCTGGRFRSAGTGECLCPSRKPFWNGELCTTRQTTTPPPSGPSQTSGPSQRRCSGGRVRNKKNRCVCPSNKPVWTGKSCIVRSTKKPPPRCSGGRVRGSRGQCVCPAHLPLWNGLLCVPRPVKRAPPPCSGGRIRLGAGPCVCPPHIPVWNGRICAPRPPQGPSTTVPQQQHKMLIPRQPFGVR